MTRMTILQLLLLSMAAVNLSSSATTCPDGAFDVVGTKSFYWSEKQRRFDSAVANCEGNSVLAVLTDRVEMEAVAGQGET